MKPKFYESDVVASVGFMERLMLKGLSLMADREGRLEDRPMYIKGQLFRYDDLTAEQIENGLVSLARVGLIQRYEAKGEKYIQVVGFKDDESPHVKEGASTIPAPDSHQTRTRKARCSHPLIPDSPSPIPDSGSLIHVASPDAQRLADLLASMIRERLPKARIPKKLGDWAADIDKLNRIDGHDWSEIERVLRWSQADNFWRANVLSGGALRRQFDQLTAQSMRSDQKAETPIDAAKAAANSAWNQALPFIEMGDHEEATRVLSSAPREQHGRLKDRLARHLGIACVEGAPSFWDLLTKKGDRP